MIKNKTMNRRKLLCNTGLLATATAFGAMPALAATKEQNAVDAFYRTGEYTSCDIKYLSDMWGKSSWDTKVFAGQKIVDGAEDFFRGELNYARQTGLNNGVRCDYSLGGYSYQDAEKLSRYWGSTVWDAKLKIGSALEQGQNLEILSAMQRAR